MLFDANIIGPTAWYIMIGFCTLMVFAPLSSMLIDRLFGAMQVNGTVTFSLNISSMVTNFGTIALLLYKDIQEGQSDSIQYVYFFRTMVYSVSIGTMVLSCLSLASWWRSLKPEKLDTPSGVTLLHTPNSQV